MRHLSDILAGIDHILVKGSLDHVVTSLHIDSRKITPGSIFIAMRGTVTDGHDYMEKAVENGASVVIFEDALVMRVLDIPATFIKVKDSGPVLGLIAAAFYDHPSRLLSVVGITGTNGKTTTATLLYQLYEQMGHKCGLLSTVQNKIHNQTEASTHTTPDAISIQELLRRMVDAGCEYAFMEVSSHAIHQHRIAGIQFAGGVFTNITHDHLDYHKTFDEYIRV